MRVLFIIITILNNLHVMWELVPMFPHRHETHAVNLFNITRLHHFRIAPNGSLLIYGGYAAKWLHPP